MGPTFYLETTGEASITETRLVSEREEGFFW